MDRSRSLFVVRAEREAHEKCAAPLCWVQQATAAAAALSGSKGWAAGCCVMPGSLAGSVPAVSTCCGGRRTHRSMQGVQAGQAGLPAAGLGRAPDRLLDGLCAGGAAAAGVAAAAGLPAAAHLCQPPGDRAPRSHRRAHALWLPLCVQAGPVAWALTCGQGAGHVRDQHHLCARHAAVHAGRARRAQRPQQQRAAAGPCHGPGTPVFVQCHPWARLRNVMRSQTALGRLQAVPCQLLCASRRAAGRQAC